MMSRYAVVAMLFVSNIFMTYAWYGHLKDFKTKALWFVILLSWGIAFFEYAIQVPANRIGSKHFTPVELKTIQEVVSLVVFTLFSYVYLRQPLSWNHLAGFGLIALGAALVFKK